MKAKFKSPWFLITCNLVGNHVSNYVLTRVLLPFEMVYPFKVDKVVLPRIETDCLTCPLVGVAPM